jgi:aarF domain-containing kinase
MKPTKRVLVMEYIHGFHIDEVDKIKKAKINAKRMGKTFSKMITKMIHKEGFVHADPHAGNLMIRKHQY